MVSPLYSTRCVHACVSGVKSEAGREGREGQKGIERDFNDVMGVLGRGLREVVGVGGQQQQQRS